MSLWCFLTGYCLGYYGLFVAILAYCFLVGPLLALVLRAFGRKD